MTVEEQARSFDAIIDVVTAKDREYKREFAVAWVDANIGVEETAEIKSVMGLPAEMVEGVSDSALGVIESFLPKLVTKLKGLFG